LLLAGAGVAIGVYIATKSSSSSSSASGGGGGDVMTNNGRGLSMPIDAPAQVASLPVASLAGNSQTHLLSFIRSLTDSLTQRDETKNTAFYSKHASSIDDVAVMHVEHSLCQLLSVLITSHHVAGVCVCVCVLVVCYQLHLRLHYLRWLTGERSRG
jgi:hypothetical protein